jgi:4-hydroxythreonine-4-phosphate dehydrogenase
VATRLVITTGEPAGIGPDLCVMVAQHAWETVLIVIGDPGLLGQRAEALRLPLQTIEVDERALPDRPAPSGSVYVMPQPLPAAVQPGVLDPANAEHVLGMLRRAVAGCRSGDFDAMVTGPLHKGVINDAGVPFTGHTEFLAAQTGGQAVMLLACPGLRVALATTHLPLRDVADALSPERLEWVLRTLHDDLQRRFGIAKPRILVCGLNPHAGEGGHLGREEQEIIEPTLERLRQAGLDLVGPLPADTLFNPKRLANADAVLAMYHDQGLPVLKYVGFGQAVNITLGLPIIRTSVDHGTALDLAATGQVDPGSMMAAIEQAASMAATAAD